MRKIAGKLEIKIGKLQNWKFKSVNSAGSWFIFIILYILYTFVKTPTWWSQLSYNWMFILTRLMVADFISLTKTPFLGRREFCAQSLGKNRNFGQKSKFWSKIEILGKNRNFGQKSKFWAKIEILGKNRNFGQK